MKVMIFPVLFVLIPTTVFAQDITSTLLEKVEGFSHPESVVYDDEREVVYVSNIGEEQAGDGFISRVSRDGEVLDMRWITGLDDPKGLQIKEDKLYVTDNTRLVELDIKEGKISRTLSIEGSKYLNDIAIDAEGSLYISDSGKSGIYKMSPSGEITEWLQTEELEYPNGLLVVDDAIYVAAWGQDGGGNVLKVDLTDKDIEKVSSRGIGNLDGIQKLEKEQAFYISDWATGKVYKVTSGGKIEEILTSEKSAGDILYLEEQKKLALPMNLQNEVWWYQLKEN